MYVLHPGVVRCSCVCHVMLAASHLLLLLLLFVGPSVPEHAWGPAGAASNARHDAGRNGRCGEMPRVTTQLCIAPSDAVAAVSTRS
jgi:hypothetical protein